MATLFIVKFTSAWRSTSMSGIVYATVIALPLSAAAIYSIAAPEQRSTTLDDMTVGVLAILSWLLVAFFVIDLRVRRAWREGVALVADSSGISFPDWRGRTRLLQWSEIDCLHLLKFHGSLMLYVEGHYSEALHNPVKFATEELDCNPHTLLSSLDRLRSESIT